MSLAEINLAADDIVRHCRVEPESEVKCHAQVRIDLFQNASMSEWLLPATTSIDRPIAGAILRLLSWRVQNSR
jgi:hypothetical protein